MSSTVASTVIPLSRSPVLTLLGCLCRMSRLLSSSERPLPWMPSSRCCSGCSRPGSAPEHPAPAAGPPPQPSSSPSTSLTAMALQQPACPQPQAPAHGPASRLARQDMAKAAYPLSTVRQLATLAGALPQGMPEPARTSPSTAGSLVSADKARRGRTRGGAGAVRYSRADRPTGAETSGQAQTWPRSQFKSGRQYGHHTCLDPCRLHGSGRLQSDTQAVTV